MCPHRQEFNKGEEKDDWVAGEFLLQPVLFLRFPTPSLSFFEEMCKGGEK
jgi:hypothetical protein